jgi:DNA-damage-inducible protein D
MLGEASTTEIARRSDAQGFVENKTSAKQGGRIAGDARKALERKTGRKVVSKSNYLAVSQRPDLLDNSEAEAAPGQTLQPKAPILEKRPKHGAK